MSGSDRYESVSLNPSTCLFSHRTLHMKSSNWILHARVGKKCLWHDALSWIWTDAWRGPRICLMYDTSYAWHGRLFCHMLNSFTHATNQWYMQCMLSIYDMLSIIDVTGVRYDRWSAPIRYSWSLLHVRRWRWLGIVMVTYIIHSVMHPLIIKSLLNSFCWDCWHVTYWMSSSLQEHYHHWTAALCYSIERVASDVRWRRWLWW